MKVFIIVVDLKKGGLVLFQGEEVKTKPEPHRLVYVPGIYSNEAVNNRQYIIDFSQIYSDFCTIM